MILDIKQFILYADSFRFKVQEYSCAHIHYVLTEASATEDWRYVPPKQAGKCLKIGCRGYGKACKEP